MQHSGRRHRSRAHLRRRRAERIGGLQRMPALHATCVATAVPRRGPRTSDTQRAAGRRESRRCARESVAGRAARRPILRNGRPCRRPARRAASNSSRRRSLSQRSRRNPRWSASRSSSARSARSCRISISLRGVESARWIRHGEVIADREKQYKYEILGRPRNAGCWNGRNPLIKDAGTSWPGRPIRKLPLGRCGP